MNDANGELYADALAAMLGGISRMVPLRLLHDLAMGLAICFTELDDGPNWRVLRDVTQAVADHKYADRRI